MDRDPETLRLLRKALPVEFWRIEGTAGLLTGLSMLREPGFDVALAALEIDDDEGHHILSAWCLGKFTYRGAWCPEPIIRFKMRLTATAVERGRWRNAEVNRAGSESGRQ